MSKWDGIHTDKALGIAGQAISFWAAVRMVVPAITAACILASIFLLMRPTVQRQQFEHEAYLDRQRAQQQAHEERLAEQRQAEQAAIEEQQREHAYIIARYRREHPGDTLVRNWEDYLAMKKVDAEQRAMREAERDAALRRQLALEAAREARRREREQWREAGRAAPAPQSYSSEPARSVTQDEQDAKDWDLMQGEVSIQQQVDDASQVFDAGFSLTGEAHDNAITAEKARQVRRWRRIRGRGN